MELAVGSLGSLLGSALGKALSGEPKYGFKDVAQTRTTQQLDPKQLQQILDDLTRAESTGRSDIISGAMNAIGMITGDTQYGARQAAITNASQSYINNTVFSSLANRIQNSFNGSDFIFPDKVKQRIIDSLPSIAEIGSNGQVKIKQDSIKEVLGPLYKTMRKGQVNYELGKINDIFTNATSNRDFQESVRNTVNSAPSVVTASLQQSNPELFSTTGSTSTVPIDPYFKSTQNLSLNALNQMAALNGIRGSDGQVGMTPDQIQANLESTPGYQFRYNQGRQAVERSASARGLLDSGAILKGLTQFGQGLASQEFGANYDRLAALAGQTANPALSGAALATTLPQQNRLAAAELYSGQGNALANYASSLAQARSSALQNSGTNTQKSTTSMLFDINNMKPVLGGR